jgi:hypothetical protein
MAQSIRVSGVRHIFRWDLDKTYLKTEFDTVRDLVRTARIPAELRQNIPGSAALIRAIRQSAPAETIHQVFFISGSPQQMRGVLEKKFALDGFSPDGFVLKPTVSNFFRGRFRAIRSQVAYKLAELINARADAPVGTQETLFGDDAENDAFIYTLYANVVSGDVGLDELRRVLKKVGAYADQVQEIEHGLESIVHERPVRRVIIHLDQRTPPAAFSAYFPLVVPIYNHLQTAIVLYMDDTLAPLAIRTVARELLESYGFDVQRLTNLAEDILRRIRLRYPLEHLDRLARDLRALAENGDLPSSAFTPPPRPPRRASSVGRERAKDPVKTAPSKPQLPAAEEHRLVTETIEVLEGIAQRALYLKGRPLPEERPIDDPRRDYVELFDYEVVRKEEARRLRKLAQRVPKPELEVEMDLETSEEPT